MKKKAILCGLMIVLALPVPISLITILGTIISLANISVVLEQSVLLATFATTSMILAGTYTLTYVFSAINTLKQKKISFISFLPILHIALTIVFFALWIITEQKYL
jgi:hypothetical protein